MCADTSIAETPISTPDTTNSSSRSGAAESQVIRRSERELLGRAVQAWPEWTEDQGSVEIYDEYGDWREDYANAVGIKRYGEI